jgi:hypothetical protein
LCADEEKKALSVLCVNYLILYFERPAVHPLILGCPVPMAGQKRKFRQEGEVFPFTDDQNRE